MHHLSRRGIKVYQWRGPMMHAKTAVIDGAWSTIGSYNFDAQSRFSNLEVTVEILYTDVGATLTAGFEADIDQCAPYDEAGWDQLPWYMKALAWLSYRLRRFL